MSDAGRKVWLITGAATGLGRAIAEHALQCGHAVVATARSEDRLAPIVALDSSRVLPCRLDVTAQDQIEAAVAGALARFGRIDVLVNNAACGLIGAVEESAPDQVRSIMDTNFFSAWAMIQAVLPHMRRQGAGVIVNVSSFAALQGFAGMGAYAASKSAMESMSEALASEVAHLGLKVIIAEPGGLATEFARSLRFADATEPYEPIIGALRRILRDGTGPRGGGDPAACARVIAEAVNAAAPPLRLPLGRDAIATARFACRRLSEELDRWEAAGSSVSPG